MPQALASYDKQLGEVELKATWAIGLLSVTGSNGLGLKLEHFWSYRVDTKFLEKAHLCHGITQWNEETIMFIFTKTIISFEFFFDALLAAIGFIETVRTRTATTPVGEMMTFFCLCKIVFFSVPIVHGTTRNRWYQLLSLQMWISGMYFITGFIVFV